MHLKTYRAGSVGQAMAMIRSELGAEALILSSRRVAGGVEIAACLDPQGDDEAPPLAVLPAPQVRRHEAAPARAQWLPKRGAPGAASLPDPLAWHGVPPGLAARLGGGDLARAIGEALRFGALPLEEHAPLILVGAPGAGKTLTTARLATRLVLAGHMPLVISADGRRAGAAEELAAYTRLLGIELIVASNAATIVRALPRRAAGAPVLIDTAGVNPFERGQLDSVLALVTAAAAMPVLVLAAGLDTNEAAEQAELYAGVQVEHMIPSRLDMVRRLGSIVAAADAGRMILSEAGTGAGATDGLTPITPAKLAEWLGRIPGAPPAAGLLPRAGADGCHPPRSATADRPGPHTPGHHTAGHHTPGHHTPRHHTSSHEGR